MLSVAGEFVAIGRVVVEHQQWIAGLRRQRPREHMHFRSHIMSCREVGARDKSRARLERLCRHHRGSEPVLRRYFAGT